MDAEKVKEIVNRELDEFFERITEDAPGIRPDEFFRSHQLWTDILKKDIERSLEDAEKAEQEEKKPPAKSRITVYLHSTKEHMAEEGVNMGMVGEALDKFAYALYEVEVDIEVDVKTGTYKALQVNIDGTILKPEGGGD